MRVRAASMSAFDDFPEKPMPLIEVSDDKATLSINEEAAALLSRVDCVLCPIAIVHVAMARAVFIFPPAGRVRESQSRGERGRCAVAQGRNWRGGTWAAPTGRRGGRGVTGSRGRRG